MALDILEIYRVRCDHFVAMIANRNEKEIWYFKIECCSINLLTLLVQ